MLFYMGSLRCAVLMQAGDREAYAFLGSFRCAVLMEEE